MNMNYCMWENTAEDMEQLLDSIESCPNKANYKETLSRSERVALLKVYELCKDIIEEIDLVNE